MQRRENTNDSKTNICFVRKWENTFYFSVVKKAWYNL